MAITGFYVDTWSGWSQNETASWTDDFSFPPANFYATAMLTGIMSVNNSFLFSGIVEYRIKNPKTGKHTTKKVGNLNVSFSLAEVILDSNVDRVTFGLGVWDTGGGDWAAQADVIHQVWLYD